MLVKGKAFRTNCLEKTEAYLEPSRTSTVEVLCENSERILAVNYFHKKAAPQIFDWVLNTPLRDVLIDKISITCIFMPVFCNLNKNNLPWKPKN